MEIEVIDESGNYLALSYEVTEERGFYGASVTLNNAEHAGATFLTDRREAQMLCDMLCRGAVTPSAFFDVIRDFIT